MMLVPTDHFMDFHRDRLRGLRIRRRNAYDTYVAHIGAGREDMAKEALEKTQSLDRQIDGLVAGVFSGEKSDG